MTPNRLLKPPGALDHAQNLDLGASQWPDSQDAVRRGREALIAEQEGFELSRRRPEPCDESEGPEGRPRAERSGHRNATPARPHWLPPLLQLTVL